MYVIYNLYLLCNLDFNTKALYKLLKSTLTSVFNRLF